MWSDPQIRRRLLFTLGVLLIYRMLRFVPLPGLDGATLRTLLPHGMAAALGYSEVIMRFSVVSLSLLPYLSAWAFMEVMKNWLGEPWTELGRGLLTVLLAAMQAYGIALALESHPRLVDQPGMAFVITTVFSLTGGTLLLLWLGNQITRRGLGNGVWMLLAADSIGTLPALAYGLSQVAILGGRVASYFVLIPALFAAAAAMFITLELAIRRIPLQQLSSNNGSAPIDLVLPLDRVSILPVFFASLLLPWLLFPTLTKPFWRHMFGLGEPAHLLLLAFLVLILTLVMTYILASPAREAERLAQDGLAVAGVPVADSGAELGAIVTRITVVTGLILAFNAVLPWLLARLFGWPIGIGGMPLLIGIIVALGIMRQLSEIDGAEDA